MAWSLIPVPAWGPLGLPACWPSQRTRRGRIGFVNPDTIAIIVAVLAVLVTVLGTGLALWRAIDSRYKDLRQDIDNRHKEGRQDMAEIRQELRALNNRIDALYQALFSRKDPAA